MYAQNVASLFPSGVRETVEVKWKPSGVGLYKVNTYIALGLNGGLVGLGLIIRDHQAFAILSGLRFAIEAGLLPCLIESDALAVVNLIRSSSIPFSETGLIIKDIRLMLENSPGCMVVFVPRKANMAAHELAKYSVYW
ncbi:hypothetical protein Dsin_032381 [Dipteronia sinensis]|uniref:RNase H type-1 domain-containing protein n=1 Tax=Dipteronia sinensis TaxID=43782 RepID=A0AAD9ZNB1_9ROSI|nr:hypothetical protein Dsin_032381 [Dipteronia sinensis]